MPNTKTEKQADFLWKNNNSALGLAISPSLYEFKFSSYVFFGVEDWHEICSLTIHLQENSRILYKISLVKLKKGIIFICLINIM